MLLKLYKIIEKLKPILVLIISLISTPVIVILVSIFAFYKFLVYLLLKYQYGAQFKGFLEGTDAVWAIEDNSRSVINTVNLIETDDVDKFINIIKCRISLLIKDPRFEKISYNRHKQYGYSFWKNDLKITVDNIVKCIENTNDLDLNQLISEYSNKKLPLNHALPMEALIVTKPIIRNNTKTNQYAIIYRIHHALGDGESLKKLLFETSDARQEKIEHKPAVVEPLFVQLKKFISNRLTLITPVFFIIGHLIKITIINAKADKLCTTKLTGQKFVTWKSEENCLSLFKMIKNRMPDATFTTILLTALSNSLYIHSAKNSKEIPKTIQIVFPVAADKITTNSDLDTDGSSLKNNFTVGTFILPIIFDGENTNIIHRLQKIKKSIKQIDLMSLMCYYWSMKVAAKYLTEPFLKLMLVADQSALALSNVQGPAMFKIDGKLVKDLMFWLPNKHTTGIGVSMLSYNGGLNFGLIADKALIANEEEINEILDNMILTIRNLELATRYLKLQT